MMALKFNMSYGESVLEQSAQRPLVYLDNWALNVFSQDKQMGDQFVRAITNKKGTLVISLMNLYEIASRDDDNQKKEIANFVDGIDCAFIEMNPWKVIAKENKLLPPYELNANIALAQSSLILMSVLKSSMVPPRCGEIVLRICGKLRDEEYSFPDIFEKELYPIVLIARSIPCKLLESKYIVKKKIMKKDDWLPYTKEIAYYFYHYCVVNENMKMAEKEWRDLFHTIVQVAYCDFVLLDRRWANFVELTGLEYPDVACVYSKSKIYQFLDDLSCYTLD